MPMLGVEKSLLMDLSLSISSSGYLHNNQRMLNTVYAPGLRDYHYILQIADYDVNCIMPFRLKQNWPFMQNQRFSRIRYGSQVDFIVPLSERFRFIPVSRGRRAGQGRSGSAHHDQSPRTRREKPKGDSTMSTKISTADVSTAPAAIPILAPDLKRCS